MINISKSGNAIKFAFTDSDHYLYGNGEIEVPVNSLSLIVDESNMVTFRKANSNDIFLSFDPANSNLSDKEGVINFYKTNMVGSTGGGGGSESGITSGEVQTMIDESLEDYYTDDEVDAGFDEVNSAVTAVDNALSAHTSNTHVHVSSQDKYNWNNKAEMSAVTAVANDVSTLSGQVATKVATSDFNAYSAATDARIAEDEEVTAAALNNLDENKQDALVYYSENTEDKTANIHIEDTENGTQSEVIVDGGSVDMYASMTEEDEDNGSMVETHSVINGNSAGVALAYEKNIDDAEATHSYLNVEEGLISMEVMADEDSTTLDVYSNGVTINGENVVTEDQLADYQPILSAGTGIEISGNVISATGGGGVTVDPTLDTGSTNPVANSAITAAIDAKIQEIDLSNQSWVGTGVTGLRTSKNGSNYTVKAFAGTINNKSLLANNYADVNMFSLVETSAITSAITSASTNDEVAGAKAVYDAIQAGGGGGATYSAGTNISIDTANTINCTLPITANTNDLKGYLLFGNGFSLYGSDTNGRYHIAIGKQISNPAYAQGQVAICPADTSSSSNSVLTGDYPIGIGHLITSRGNGAVAIGDRANANGNNYVAIGKQVNATGTTKMNLNDQIKVDTNNQVYIKDKTNTTDVCIQDAIAALGGLKFVQCTQAEYDALVSGGTVDSSTIYFITNVVS